MKSPTKQEEGIEIQRKIRVKILDPDATESSSDEQEKRPKFIVHEIIQEKVKIQAFSQKNKTHLDFYQFSGKLSPMIRKRKCGKFATEEKLKVVKNAKEAISAKSEIGSSSDPPLMVDSSKVKTCFDQFCGKLPPMVRKRKSGKFSTEIRDPFSKKRIWLGTFDTPEEASEVYQSKKLEFEKLKKAKNANVKKAISAKSFGTAEEASEVYQSKKFEFEEKLKKAKNANVKTVISAKSEMGSSSRNTSDSSKVFQSFSLKKRKSLSFDQFCGKLPHMVSKRKSGKFGTEIRNPFSKKRIWLGTFDTAEEASEVYQSKKFEFEEKLKKAKNANVRKAISAKFELGSFSNDPPLMVDSQTSDSSNELDDQLRKAISANVKMAISAKSELGYSSSDPPLMVDCQTSDSSNEFDERLKKTINAKEKKAISAKSELVSSSSSDPTLVVDAQTSDSSNGQESEEEMWMGQWIRISGDKEVKFSHKLGVPVVDNYGFLLGEFSKLDDLSISI